MAAWTETFVDFEILEACAPIKPIPSKMFWKKKTSEEISSCGRPDTLLEDTRATSETVSRRASQLLHDHRFKAALKPIP
jgi:hypothetical protein